MREGERSIPLSAGQRLARRVLAELETATATPPGITRAAYGDGEQFAHDLVRGEAEALGALPRVDAAGNLYLSLPGEDPLLPRIIIGSHLDTVPHGGNYDGAAGVVAGLAVMADLVEDGARLKRALTVMVTRAEEAAWFPLSYPGSRAALGLLEPAELKARRSDTGDTLHNHMARAGFDPEAVSRRQVQIGRDDIEAFIEVHIEQGPRLVAGNHAIGIVTGIAGGFRHVDARCLGAYAHSGAEPRFSRRDSVLGFSDLLQGLEATWDRLEREGREATITVGRLQSDPSQHGGSRVLGDLSFTLDVRSTDPATLEAIRRHIPAIAAEVEACRNVAFDFGEAFEWTPAAMDAALIDRLLRSASVVGPAPPLLPSGAGHDAAAFAEAGIASAMLFVRNENGSHNPDENMDIADLDVAVQLLEHFIRTYDQP